MGGALPGSRLNTYVLACTYTCRDQLSELLLGPQIEQFCIFLVGFASIIMHAPESGAGQCNFVNCLPKI